MRRVCAGKCSTAALNKCNVTIQSLVSGPSLPSLVLGIAIVFGLPLAMLSCSVVYTGESLVGMNSTQRVEDV